MPYNHTEYMREYRKKDKHKQYQKQYRQTEKAIKNRRITNWKIMGVISENYDELYEKYINTEFCELCNVKLTEGKLRNKTTRCLDHDHSINDCENVRNIVCQSCNSKLPRQNN